MLVFLNKKLEETKMERRKQASRLVRRETRGAAKHADSTGGRRCPGDGWVGSQGTGFGDILAHMEFQPRLLLNVDRV